MCTTDPILLADLPAISKIIDDETWLEGERRGGWVAREDPVVMSHVCDVIARVGAELRRQTASRLGVPAHEFDQDWPHAA